MGTSFVRFNKRGFWSADGYVELWLHFLAQEVDTLPEAPEWLQRAAQFIKLLAGELTSAASSPDSLPSVWQSEEKSG
jgi:hypothetical protein